MRKLSPAAKVRARKEAEKQKSTITGSTRTDLNVKQQMLAMLYEHKRTLKQIQSKVMKGTQKAKLLPDYWPYVQGVLKADSGQPDEVITTICMWCIDAKMIDEALMLAAYILKHDLTLPEAFQRTTNVAIAEEIAELALKEDSPVTPEHLTALYELVGDTDMPDQVRVKLEKAVGLGLKDIAPEVALKHLKAALAINDRAGVKPDVKALEKQIAEASAQKDENSASGDTPEA